jgi:ABC-type polysaccharide transport system permease subunit
MLLPGYVIVILGIGLFFYTPVYNALHGMDVAFDIFSAIIFIVAGPAVGFHIMANLFSSQFLSILL